ncbi:GFA family protein [Hyphomicrobium sp.]|uniref:GFA family protein n=1 Tax=Hyphomicrobium sp. TaxID=82 RepID=UPI000F9E3836|nr:GFA family protein [Hyphomicrobium sp.]RUP00626.1 MAG: GFA family protein [Hyphomicrobium sp.]
MPVHRTGSCLCRSVSYEVTGDLDAIDACHCSMCAKTSGNYAAMARCASADVKILNDETLRWYRSSDTSERGFCARCGGNLFWRNVGGNETYVTAGTLDPPTGLKIKAHIFATSKSDYYDITDGLPQKHEW